MKLATVEWNEEQIVVIENEENGKLLPLANAAKVLFKEKDCIPKKMLEIITGGDEILSTIKDAEEWAKDQEVWLHPNEVTWLAPIPRPTKNIFCVGKNYKDHAIEMGSAADIPEHVMLFSKAPTSVIGHGSNIPSHDKVTDQLDYEGELAVVIGKKGMGIKKENAYEYIFGYTIMNDVTARDLQTRHKQFLLGKSLDGTCPMGPYIVHKSVIENPENLHIETKVNGEIRQNGNTEQFIFSIAEIIEVLSKGMTLEPGDIIATGTPAGVGKGYKPPRFLKKHDHIEISIEKIGTLRNQVI